MLHSEWLESGRFSLKFNTVIPVGLRLSWNRKRARFGYVAHGVYVIASATVLHPGKFGWLYIPQKSQLAQKIWCVCVVICV